MPDYLIDLWRKYHEAYAELFKEYDPLVGQASKNKHLKKMHPCKYGPKWSKFLLIESEEELKSYLAKAHPAALKVISRESNTVSIECLIVSMREALKSWHYWEKYGTNSGSQFGAIPASRSGAGRHHYRNTGKGD